MKALDIVKTPKGALAIVDETHDRGTQVSITFIGGGNPSKEHNAWWNERDLTVVDSLPRLLAACMAHPFGNGKIDAELFFGMDKPNEQSLEE